MQPCNLLPQPLLPLKVSSAMPDLSSSPSPSATIRSYCFFVAAVRGSFRPRRLPSFSAMPESLAAWAAEKKQAWSRFCISSPSVLSTCELAPVWERTSRNIVRSSPRASPSARPSARPAVLMFMTMLTSALTWAAWPAGPTYRIDELSFSSNGLGRFGFHPNVHVRRNGSAVDEELVARAAQQPAFVDVLHCPVVRHDREHHIAQARDQLQPSSGDAAQLARERLSRLSVDIIDSGDFIAALLEPARHVAAHPPHADESNFLSHNASTLQQIRRSCDCLRWCALGAERYRTLALVMLS